MQSKYFDLLQEMTLTQQYPDNFNEVLEKDNKEIELFFQAVEQDDIFTVREMLSKNKLLTVELN